MIELKAIYKEYISPYVAGFWFQLIRDYRYVCEKLRLTFAKRSAIHQDLGQHLRAHGDIVAEERNRYLAVKYERERQQNETDFNIVNTTRERMKSINQARTKSEREAVIARLKHQK